ncbi:MAG TPA: ABC transporter permease [Rectinemataceae bacterium]|nr:ABC transporter permease [Rectinemataceae bacterium]
MRAAKARSGGSRLLDAILAAPRTVSIFVVVLGFVCGTILILAVGRNPGGMYAALVQTLTGFDLTRGTWNSRYIGEWLTASMPLILCGMSMGFAARTGLFNIGAEGQYIVGLSIAQAVALFGPQVSGLHWILAVLAAGIGGAAWGGIVGWLKAKYAVSEVVATIMLNYIAFFLSRYFTRLIPDANTYQTPAFPQTARIPSGIFDSLTNGSRLNAGIWVTLLCVLAYWFIIERTRLGFSLRATGLNKDAARYGGIRVTRSIVVSMGIAGSFAGLAGAIVALGSFSYGRVLGGYDNYGFNGIAVALVGNSTGGGTLVSGLLFGMLASAQPLMQSRQIPKEVTWIISGLVVVFISLRTGFQMLIDWRAKRMTARDEAANGGQDA